MVWLLSSSAAEAGDVASIARVEPLGYERLRHTSRFMRLTELINRAISQTKRAGTRWRAQVMKLARVFNLINYLRDRWRRLSEGSLLSHELRSEQEARFAEYARVQTLRIVRPLLLSACFIGLLWWPLDFFLYAGRPEVLRAFAFWRVTVIVYCLGYYFTCDRWALLRRHYGWWGGILGALVNFFIAASLGSLGSLEEPWFGSLYLSPMMTLPFFVNLRTRVAGVAAVMLASLIGFFGLHPANLAHPDVGTSIGILTFASALAVFAGHAIYYLFRFIFLQSEQLADQNQALEDFSASLTERVEVRTAELRLLAEYTEELQKAGRVALARELHDEFGQLFTCMRLELDLAEREQARGGDVTYLHGKLEELIDAMLISLRSILSNLRPRILDDFGLVAALEWLVADAVRRSGLDIRFTSKPNEFKVSKELGVAGFRIVQESLTNALKHADAQTVYVSVELCDGELFISVTDDGVGLSSSQRPFSLGVIGMRERALALQGTFDLSSPPLGGALVEVRLPTRLPVA